MLWLCELRQPSISTSCYSSNERLSNRNEETQGQFQAKSHPLQFALWYSSSSSCYYSLFNYTHTHSTSLSSITLCLTLCSLLLCTRLSLPLSLSLPFNSGSAEKAQRLQSALLTTSSLLILSTFCSICISLAPPSNISHSVTFTPPSHSSQQQEQKNSQLKLLLVLLLPLLLSLLLGSEIRLFFIIFCFHIRAFAISPFPTGLKQWLNP